MRRSKLTKGEVEDTTCSAEDSGVPRTAFNLDTGTAVDLEVLVEQYSHSPFAELVARSLSLQRMQEAESSARRTSTRAQARDEEAGVSTLVNPTVVQVTYLGAAGRVARCCATARTKIMLLIYAFSIMSFVVVGMQELFPLFAANEAHGLGMQPQTLGVAIAPVGISLLFYPLLLPHLIKRIGVLNMFRVGCLIFFIVNAAIPQLVVLREHQAVLWPTIVCVSMARGIGGVSTFASGTILLQALITDSTTAGYWNGLNDSICAAGKAAAPTLTGAMFAVATRTAGFPNANTTHTGPTSAHAGEHASVHSFPFDEHMPFYFVCLLCGIAAIISVQLGRMQ